MLYMDRTERLFKLGTTCFSGLLIHRSLSRIEQPYTRAMAAAVCSHCLNFLVNGQLWVLMKNFDLVSTSTEEFRDWNRLIARKAETSSSIAAAATYGSLARHELSTTSDLDVRIVRRPGVLNGLRACSLVAALRFRALIRRFPLDIYVVDSTDSLERLRDDEPPILLSNKDDIF